MAGSHVQEITAAAFQRDVVERSMEVPVLLDFWAAWCGPCRTLGPTLEKVAADYGGAFVLGKVDTEREQDLAYAFGVQGIPFCVLLHKGRPVDAFTGALPEREVIAFLERHGVRPAAGEMVAEAPPIDPTSPSARLERARDAGERGDRIAALAELEGFPEEDPLFDAAERLRSGLDWLAADLAADRGEAERLLLDGRSRFLAGDYEAAMQAVLDSVAADRNCRDGLARRAMLLCFSVVGEEAELLDDYRRRLATLLY